MDFWQGIESQDFRALEETFQPELIVDKENCLKPERVQRLLFFSFRFSQGSQDLQNIIFEYLHEKFPNYRVNPADYNLNKIELEAKVKKFFASRSLRHTDNLVDDPSEQIVKNLKELEENLNSADLPDSDIRLTLIEIVGLVLQQDYIYTVQMGERPSKDGDSEYSRFDKFSSHFVDYGMRRVRTGLFEYDQMFEDIINTTKKYIKNNPDWETETNSPLMYLRKVIDCYNENHPTQIVDINDLIS